MDDPILASAHELATAIQSREVSSAEVVDVHLAQIDRHNARLNAVVTLDEDGARERRKKLTLRSGGERRGDLSMACRSPLKTATLPPGCARPGADSPAWPTTSRPRTAPSSHA